MVTKRELLARHRVARLRAKARLLQSCIRFPHKRQGGPECVPRWREEWMAVSAKLAVANEELRRARHARLERQRLYGDPAMNTARMELKGVQIALMEKIKQLQDGTITPKEARAFLRDVKRKSKRSE